jgi:uncharacterized membrane-anchored protein YhcB (DUF1043 family)
MRSLSALLLSVTPPTQPPPPSDHTVEWIGGAFTVLAAIVAGYFAYRASRYGAQKSAEQTQLAALLQAPQQMLESYRLEFERGAHERERLEAELTKVREQLDHERSHSAHLNQQIHDLRDLVVEQISEVAKSFPEITDFPEPPPDT